MRELEIEIKRLRVLMNQAFDDGDEIAGDSYIDEIDVLAKILNSGMSKDEYARWMSLNEHERENNYLPAEIRSAVIDAINDSNLNKEMVDEWNSYLDFDSNFHSFGFSNLVLAFFLPRVSISATLISSRVVSGTTTIQSGVRYFLPSMGEVIKPWYGVLDS